MKMRKSIEGLLQTAKKEWVISRTLERAIDVNYKSLADTQRVAQRRDRFLSKGSPDI